MTLGKEILEKVLKVGEWMKLGERHVNGLCIIQAGNSSPKG